MIHVTAPACIERSETTSGTQIILILTLMLCWHALALHVATPACIQISATLAGRKTTLYTYVCNQWDAKQPNASAEAT